MLSRDLLFLTQQHGRFQPIHLWHLHIHQHQIVGPLLQRRQSFSSIAGDNHMVATLLKKPYGQLLVDRVVFRQQNMQARCRPTILLQRVLSNHGNRSSLLFRIQNPRDGLSQLRLTNRFQKIRRDPQLSAACSVSSLATRGKHHDRRGRQLRPFIDLFHKPKPVHLGHMHIGQDEAVWFVGLSCNR